MGNVHNSCSSFMRTVDFATEWEKKKHSGYIGVVQLTCRCEFELTKLGLIFLICSLIKKTFRCQNVAESTFCTRKANVA